MSMENLIYLETASNVSEYMLHKTSITTDSGYHSPHPTVPTHVDASSSTMVPGSVNKVPCPFSQGKTSLNLPGKMDKIPSQVLCEDTGHPNVKSTRTSATSSIHSKGKWGELKKCCKHVYALW